MKIKLGALAVALAYVALVAVAYQLKYGHALSRGLAMAESGACEEALSILEKNTTQAMRAEDPEKAVSFHYWSGSCELQRGNHAQAIKHLESVVETESDSTHKDAAYLLGQAHYQLEELRAAKINFERSIKQGYKVGASYFLIGDCYQRMEQDVYAERSFRKVLEQPETDNEMREVALFRLAELHFEVGEEMRDRKTASQLLQKKALPNYQRLVAMKGAHSEIAKRRLAEIRQLVAQK